MEFNIGIFKFVNYFIEAITILMINAINEYSKSSKVEVALKITIALFNTITYIYLQMV